MKFRTSFLFSVHLMAFASFQALIQTNELPGIFSFFAVGMISVSFVFNLKYKHFQFPKPLVNAAVLAGFIFFLADWIQWSKSLLMASAHFLILLLMIKLFTLKRSKDYIQLFLVSFLQILAASALSIHLSFAFSLLFYLMVATWGMILYQMKAEIEERNRLYGFQGGMPLPDTFESEEVITLPFFLTTLGVGVFSFIFTLLIFFIIPRVGVGLLQKKEGEIRTSGFSERVDFGSMAPVKLDPTVVMRVFLPSVPAKMYIKGTSFNVYDGRAWKNTLHHQQTIPVGEEVPSLQPEGEKNIKQQNGGQYLQEYIVEPMDTEALFALAQPIRLEAPFHYFNMDEMGNLLLQFKPGFRMDYKVSSLVPVIAPEDKMMRSPAFPDSREKESFVEITFPEKEKLIQLAQEVTKQAKTVFEKAEAIEQFLKGNYTYSLSVASSKDYSVMTDFLFYQKKGYCEHFATGMVLMLRSLGIPSRLVTGYAPDEWNPYGNYYKVRQSDAHAWVEVYFPKSGWMTFDPTPSVPVHPTESTLAARMKQAFLPLDQFLDAVRLKWDRYVIHYSIQDQIEMAGEIQKKGAAAGELFKNSMDDLISSLSHLKKTALVVLGVLMVLVFLGVMIRFYPELLRRLYRRPDQSQVAFYSGLLQVLARYRLYKNPSQTPYEFLRESSQALHRMGIPFYHGTKRITDLYYRIRYGGETLSEDDRSKVEEILETLRSYTFPSRPS